MKEKILVTGAGGQLGQEFQALAIRHKDPRFVFWNRQYDITEVGIFQEIRKLSPIVIINCAAYTKVDHAETEAPQAYRINAEAVGRLGEIAAQLDIPIIHFSSDYVYHNSLNRPLREDDPVRPKGIYAKSKLKGEQLLLKAHPYPLILRVSWLYSTFGHNFPKTILRLAKEREHLNVVYDQKGAPTYARDLSESIYALLSKFMENKSQLAGIYNYANVGYTNWAEIAQFIVDFSHLNCRINPIRSINYPTAAPRPRNSRLNLTKFSQTFDQEIRNWQESMKECLFNLKNEMVHKSL